MCLGDALITDVLELGWGTDKLLADLFGELDYRDEVSDAESEAHLDLFLAFTMILPSTKLKGRAVCIGIC